MMRILWIRIRNTDLYPSPFLPHPSPLMASSLTHYASPLAPHPALLLRKLHMTSFERLWRRKKWRLEIFFSPKLNKFWIRIRISMNSGSATVLYTVHYSTRLYSCHKKVIKTPSIQRIRRDTLSTFIDFDDSYSLYQRPKYKDLFEEMLSLKKSRDMVP